jgi:hypothetical protein
MARFSIEVNEAYVARRLDARQATARRRDARDISDMLHAPRKTASGAQRLLAAIFGVAALAGLSAFIAYWRLYHFVH